MGEEMPYLTELRLDGTASHSRTQAPLSRFVPEMSLIMRILAVVGAFDFLSIVIGFATVGLIRDAQDITNWRELVVLLVPLYFIVAINGKAFTLANLRDPFRSIRRGVTAFVISTVVLLVGAYYLKESATIPRLTIGLGVLLSMILIAMSRYYTARNLNTIGGGNPYKTGLIWEEGTAQPHRNVSLVIIFGKDVSLAEQLHNPMLYDRLAKVLRGMANVVVACEPENRVRWAHLLKGANIQSEIFVPELDALAPLGVSRHGGHTSLIIAKGPLGIADRGLKRLFDLIVAGGALLFLWPVLGIIALAIKMDSPGPVFFRQDRIGRANEVFRIFKFRTMHVAHADHAGARSTARGDDRITKVGRWLRATSLDELPQLLNIVGGAMSVVGPRPHALGSRAADKLFWEVDGRYWHRHAAKPGLTGLAQIRGHRGATPHEFDLAHRLQSDLEYLDTWSIWRDIKILFLTFRVIVHRNAF